MNRYLSSPRLPAKLLVCIVPTRPEAEAIMRRLEAENFTDDHISVVFPTTGALTMPGLGAFIAAGPIIAALRRATTEVSAGIAVGLAALGVREHKAKRCQERLEGGDFLLSVHATSELEAARAKKIFAEMGAQEICDQEAPALAADSLMTMA